MDKELRNDLPEEENEAAEAVNDTEETADKTAEEAQSEAVDDTENTESESVDENDFANGESVANDEQTEPEETDVAELCIICGENKKGEDSNYCPSCEEKAYKSKVPLLAWLSGFAVICVSVFAFVISALVSAPALQTMKGDNAAANNCWYTAYVEYSQVSTYVDEITNIIKTQTPFVQAGRGIDEKIIASYAKARSPLDAVYMARTIYGESALDDLKGVSEYVELYDEFYENYSAMSETIDGMLDKADKDETIAALEAFKGVEGINEVYRNYFLFSAADFYKLGYKEELKYIEAAEASAKEQGRDFSWLYYIEIADVLCQEGEYDLALKYVDVLAEKDKNNYRAYDLQMRIAAAKSDTDKASKVLAEFKANNEGYESVCSMESGFYRCIGELEKSEVVCNEGLNSNDYSAEIHRQLALLYLIQGDYANAFDEAFTANSNANYMSTYYMDSTGFTPQLDNTIYLCAKLCKDNNLAESENADYIDQILEYYTSFEPSKQVSSIISGEKTVKEVLTEGVCDLA